MGRQVTFLALLMLAIGGYLTTTSLQNRNPKETLIALLKGEPLPTTPWYQRPVTFAPQNWSGVGGIAGRGALAGTGSSNPNSDIDTQGGPRQPGNRRQTVVNYALAQSGERYVFGASGPDQWDCSGLTMRAYQQVGIRLPHHAATQQTMGTPISETAAQPGDLVFWGPLSGHVAMYLGNGQVVHAPKTGDVVKTTALWDKKNIRFRSYL